jgi:hypothetical protein
MVTILRKLVGTKWGPGLDVQIQYLHASSQIYTICQFVYIYRLL